MTPIEKAVEIAGGQTALAEICGVRQQQVWNWINRQGRPPTKYCNLIAAATKVPAEALRPDTFQTTQSAESEAVA